MDSGDKLKHHSVVNCCQLSYQYSWTTRKKRSLKPFKSKGEDGETRATVFNRKRKHSRDDSDDSAVKTNAKRRRKICKVEEISDEYYEDDDCILGDWVRRNTAKKRNEEVMVTIESGEYFKGDDCTVGNWFSEMRDRRQVELEEDEEWEEEVRLCSKIKATSSRSRTRYLSSNSPENVTDVSPSRSRSPASDVSDSILKNGISNDCTTSRKQVNLSLYSIKEEISMCYCTEIYTVLLLAGIEGRRPNLSSVLERRKDNSSHLQ